MIVKALYLITCLSHLLFVNYNLIELRNHKKLVV